MNPPKKWTKRELRRFIAQGNILQAVEELMNMGLPLNIENEVVSISASLNSIQKAIQAGTISDSEAAKDRNYVTRALLKLIDDIPESLWQEEPSRSVDSEPTEEEAEEEEVEFVDRSIEEDYQPGTEEPVYYTSGQDDHQIAPEIDDNKDQYAGFSSDSATHAVDQLGITPDVEAFSNLISSRELNPPLSIGLFGDWGSGKSFFMNQMIKTVNENAKGFKQKVKNEVEDFEKRYKAAAGKEEEIKKLVLEILPDPDQQIKQIKEWIKHKDSWAYASLLKIYGNDNRAVDKAIKDLIRTPKEATDQLRKKLAEKQKNQAIQIALDAVGNSNSAWRKIEELADAKFSQAYCKNISQIQFNAWHYIDTNLWASLITHIFEKLHSYIGNLPQEEAQQIQLYRTLANTRLQMKETEEEILNIEKEKSKIEKDIQQLRKEREEERAELNEINFSTIWSVLKDQNYIQATGQQLKNLLGDARKELGINVGAELKIAESLDAIKLRIEELNTSLDGDISNADLNQILDWNTSCNLIEQQVGNLIFIDDNLNQKLHESETWKAWKEWIKNSTIKIVGEAQCQLQESELQKLQQLLSKEDLPTTWQSDLQPFSKAIEGQIKQLESLRNQLQEQAPEFQSKLFKIDQQLSKNLDNLNKFAETGDLQKSDKDLLTSLITTDKSVQKTLENLQSLKSDAQEAKLELKTLESNIAKAIQAGENAKAVTINGPDLDTFKATLQQAKDELDALKKKVEDPKSSEEDIFSRINLDARQNWDKIIGLFDAYNSSRGQLLTAFRDFKKMSTTRKAVYLGFLLTIIVFWFFAETISSFEFEHTLLAWLNAPENVQGVSALIAGGFSLVELIPTFIKRAESALSKVNTAVSLLNKAKMQLTELENRATLELSEQIDERMQALERKDAELQALEMELSELTGKLVSLEEEKDAIEHGKRLSSFIEERLKDSDYKKHLGLISIIRNDLEKLTTYLHNRGQHSKVVSQLHDVPGKLDKNNPYQLEKVDTIDRIILYIDDLDRCPPEKVAEVLQAIHLILAFELFVVVVGVDIRWVSKSLIKKYGRMLSSSSSESENGIQKRKDWNATPYDYLEKIFQIPFRLRRMEDFYRKKYLTELLEEDVKTENNETIISDTVQDEFEQLPEPTADTQSDNQESVENVLSATQSDQTNIPGDGATNETAEEQNSDREFEQVNLSDTDIEFIQTLTPIMTGSPRTLKRFANICRLIKSHDVWGKEKSLDEITQYQGLLFLLALVIGKPVLGQRMMTWIKSVEDESLNLGTFVKDINDNEIGSIDDNELQEQWQLFRQFIMNDPVKRKEAPTKKEEDKKNYPTKNYVKKLRTIKVVNLKELTRVAARYSFRFTQY